MKREIENFINYYGSMHDEIDNETHDYFSIQDTLEEENVIKNNLKLYPHQISCINYMLFKSLYKNKPLKSYYNFLVEQNPTYYDPIQNVYNESIRQRINNINIPQKYSYTDFGVLSSEIGSGKTLMSILYAYFFTNIINTDEMKIIKTYGNDFISIGNNKKTFTNFQLVKKSGKLLDEITQLLIEYITEHKLFTSENNVNDDYDILNYINTHTKIYGPDTRYYPVRNNTTIPEIKYNKCTTPIIVVPHYLINQWIDEIKKYTNLTYHKISTVRDSMQLEDLNEYDIVLLNVNKFQNFFRFHNHLKTYFDLVMYDEMDVMGEKTINYTAYNHIGFQWYITTTFERLINNGSRDYYSFCAEYKRVISTYYDELFARYQSYFTKKNLNLVDINNVFFNIKNIFQYEYVIKPNITGINILRDNDYNKIPVILPNKMHIVIEDYNLFKYNILNNDNLLKLMSIGNTTVFVLQLYKTLTTNLASLFRQSRITNLNEFSYLMCMSNILANGGLNNENKSKIFGFKIQKYISDPEQFEDQNNFQIYRNRYYDTIFKHSPRTILDMERNIDINYYDLNKNDMTFSYFENMYMNQMAYMIHFSETKYMRYYHIELDSTKEYTTTGVFDKYLKMIISLLVVLYERVSISLIKKCKKLELCGNTEKIKKNIEKYTCEIEKYNKIINLLKIDLESDHKAKEIVNINIMDNHCQIFKKDLDYTNIYERNMPHKTFTFLTFLIDKIFSREHTYLVSFHENHIYNCREIDHNKAFNNTYQIRRINNNDTTYECMLLRFSLGESTMMGFFKNAYTTIKKINPFVPFFFRSHSSCESPDLNIEIKDFFIHYLCIGKNVVGYYRKKYYSLPYSINYKMMQNPLKDSLTPMQMFPNVESEIDFLNNNNPYKKEKYKEFRTVIQNINQKNNKIIIFTDNNTDMGTIEKNLLQLYISYSLIAGNNHVIKSTIKKYNNGEVNIILMNSKSYASGLDLSQTTHIVILSKLDVATERQAIGRAKRIGKEKASDLTVIYIYDEVENIEILDI